MFNCLLINSPCHSQRKKTGVKKKFEEPKKDFLSQLITRCRKREHSLRETLRSHIGKDPSIGS